MPRQRVIISSGEDGPDIGMSLRTSAIFTRPNNTTQYTAGDNIGNSTGSLLTFYNVVNGNGGNGIVVDAVCSVSVAQSTKPNLRLYLFDGTSTVTGAVDNAKWAPTDADMKNYIGHAEFSSWELGTGNIVCRDDQINAPFTCLSSSKNLHGILVERSTYTPVASEAWKVRLGVLKG